MDNRNAVWRHVDAQSERLIALSERVWGMPEVCYTETRSWRLTHLTVHKARLVDNA